MNIGPKGGHIPFADSVDPYDSVDPTAGGFINRLADYR